MDNLNRIATTDSRLIRRIVRDHRTRGNSATDTLRRWESVRRGEDKHIFPNQEQADLMFNSSLFYELSVLKDVRAAAAARSSGHGARIRRSASVAEIPRSLHLDGPIRSGVSRRPPSCANLSAEAVSNTEKERHIPGASVTSCRTAFCANLSKIVQNFRGRRRGSALVIRCGLLPLSLVLPLQR